MANLSKAVIDRDLREQVLDDIFSNAEDTIYTRINDRQWGVLLTDLNGVERYVRIGAIVAEEREDMTAAELMQSEIDKYKASVQKKEETARRKAEKIEKDRAEREAKEREMNEKRNASASA